MLGVDKADSQDLNNCPGLPNSGRYKMKQSTVRALLSRLTEQLVLYFFDDGKITDTKEYSERLALATWEGLILLLRQSIADSDEVLLEEVGYFRKIGDEWVFRPAASLLEVDALKLEPTESQLYLVQKALFHLQQGADLLANVVDDQELPSEPETDSSEIKLLGAIFGADAVSDSILSDRIDRLGTRLTRTARRLRRGVDVGRQLGDRTAEYYEATRARAGELYSQAAELVSEVGSAGKERSRKQEGPVTEAINAGKRAYREEKRRIELKGEAEAEAGSAASTA